MDQINKEIGIRIAEARKNKGLTTTALSKITGFSTGRISHWENGRRLPNIDSVLVLQKILDVPADYLLCVEKSSATEIKKTFSLPFYKLSNLDFDTPFSEINITLPLDIERQGLFAVQLIDDSMGGLYRKNDIVVLKRSSELVEGSSVLLKINNTGQVLFRKFLIDNSNIENPTYKFISLNAEYETVATSNPKLFTILGYLNDSIRLFI